MSEINNESIQGIAIIGMACRFPKSANVDEFWKLLTGGVEAIVSLSEEELRTAGIDPILSSNPSYVKSRGILAGIDLFDAEFFSFSPKEAELTDPQHRLFLECAWTALEDAGYDPDSYDGNIGVYAGAGWNSYMLFNLASHRGLLESDVGHQALLGNDKDNLTTRVSYKLNLKGPSVTVQTGCSTSLVGISLACESLLSYQCDLALAGGVSIMIPQGGYLYRSGGIFSPDGHCRAFDARAQGTVLGSGVGIVVLKRLEDAIADRDDIYAIIRGTAINNDGAFKAGYTAPSVEGQAKVIVAAQSIAGVSPETITYVEAHGTGTKLGDPVEILALTKAFRDATSARNFCAIGSVKTNIGHLDAAAGVAGLIKTVLALKNKEIPPSLNFNEANPEIDFSSSPFYVNTSLTKWKTEGIPRRAGVSSFGLGGTNAHVILEEAPLVNNTVLYEGSPKLIVLSAKTNEGLEKVTNQLACHLKQHPELALADVAYTLQVGRKALPYRRFVICNSTSELIGALESLDLQRVHSQVSKRSDPPVVFMFPGQGAQYVNMARGLYETEPTFRREIDLCFDILSSQHALDLRHILYPSDTCLDSAAERLRQTENAQPALFVVEYALARMLMSWGINMHAAIGHSVGEYVAATLAGVFSLDESLLLVTMRGHLMQKLPPGAMLSVSMSATEIIPLLESDLSIAAINELSSCVVSGTVDAIMTLQRKLESREIVCRRVDTSHAFHSYMMEQMLESFMEYIEGCCLKPPALPLMSNVTGRWLTDTEATDTSYWIRHIRQPVRFAESMQTLLQTNDQVLIEIGPGLTLSRLVKRHPDRKPHQQVLSTLSWSQDKQSDMATVLKCLGELWLAGVKVDWSACTPSIDRCRRIHLPTYPFNHQRYWIKPAPPFEPRLRSNDFWQVFNEAAHERVLAGIEGFDTNKYLKNLDRVDDLCVAYINLAIQQLGAFARPTERYSINALLQSCQIIPRYYQLVTRMLSTLLERNQLQQEGDLLTDFFSCSLKTAEAIARDVELEGVDRSLIHLIQTCGQALPKVLLGEQEPLDLFSSMLEKESEDFSSQKSLEIYYNSILCCGLEQILKRLPPQGKLRILEIGGGTGIATAALLPMLSPEQTHYTFTDISKFFLSRAQKKFSAYSFVHYGVLDIEKSPIEQGYSSESYDVVVAVNMLHVTRDISETLTHVRSLLAPGGLLLVFEITRPTLDFDVTYGLLMNPLQDGERTQGNPFLSRNQWVDAILSHGFAQVTTFPEEDVFGKHIFVAQAKTTTTATLPAFSCLADSAKLAQLSLAKKNDIADWFYIPSWKRTSYPQSVETSRSERWLVFVDQCGLGKRLVEGLEQRGHQVITVEVGEKFCCEDDHTFKINPRLLSDYIVLLEKFQPLNMVHLWGLMPNGQRELVENSQFLDFYSLILLAQAIGEVKLTELIDITIISHHQQDVTGEEMIFPEKAMTIAPCKVIPLEYPNVHCRSLDIVFSNKQYPSHLIEQLLDEIESRSSDQIIAYRGSHRWVANVESVRLIQPTKPTPRLKKNGVYLITGGLGKIGLTIAEYLAKTVAAKLILTSRSALSRPEIKLRELEAMGSEVLVMNADVADLKDMKMVVSRAQEKFGSINGVIHSAGILGDGAIQHKTKEDIDQVLRPKVLGTIILDIIFKDTPLDFFVLFSSISALKPGFGQVAYSAANNFLDAFVKSNAAQNYPFVTCISWDVWQEEGMAYEASAPLILQELKEADFKQRGILPNEGTEVFHRILSSKYSHLIVSTSDYLKSKDHDLSSLYLDQMKQTDTFHPRPNLSSTYIPPESKTEKMLTQIWEELLGIHLIGVEDNFFEIGGDSLIGTQLINRIKVTFGVSLPIKSVYLYPMIRSMSTVIEETLISQVSSEKLDEVLREVEGLKQEE